MARRKIIFWGAFLAASAACVGWSYHERFSAEQRLLAEASSAREEAQRIQRDVVMFTDRVVPARLPFVAVLAGLGIDGATAAHLAASAQSVFDLRHLRAGNRLEVGRSVFGEFREVRYRIDTDRVLSIAPQGNDFHSEIQTIPSETEEAGVAGEIHGSLFEAVVDAGEKPELAMRMADIFGWDLDFYTDPRPGDTFRVVVEKKTLSNGEFAAYGRILAAEYVNNGRRAYRAVLFHDPARRSGVLHAGRKVDEEGVPALAAEICRADYVAFQLAPIPSDPEGVPPAPGHRLRRADGHAGADDRRWPRDFRGAQGRRREIWWRFSTRTATRRITCTSRGFWCGPGSAWSKGSASGSSG